ncbi:MAG: acylneuraminate cytidylyltransferase family protein [Patescibacteria group bacterium]
MKAIAVIPARGGSKGVPRKNIRTLGSVPLIAWTILAARRVPAICDIVVNTDDEEIANVASSFGAKVYRRAPHLGADLTTDLEVFTDYLCAYVSDMPDMIVDLRATSPFRGARRISEGIELLDRAGKERADSVRAVTVVEKHPYKMWRMESDMLIPLFSENPEHIADPFNMPRQALPSIYQNNGCMNAFWTETILQQRSMTGKRILGYAMTAEESINIDTENDFQRAERLVTEQGLTPKNLDEKIFSV